ncbi:TPA: hypothetical protein ACX37K_004440 [Serratia marcescens]
MDNKLSELKAAAAKYSAALKAHRENPSDHRALYAWDEAATEFSRVVGHNELEIIIALLAELEAKDKRIAELEGQLHSGFTPEALAQEERAENAEQRVSELEAKLATPVRLPRTIWYEHDDLAHEIPVLEKAKIVAEIRAAGFTVAGDG